MEDAKDWKTYKIHLFKIEGESVLHVKAPNLQEAQQEAFVKAPELKFTKCRAPYLAIAFDELEAVELS